MTARSLDEIPHMRLFEPRRVIEAIARGVDSSELNLQLRVMVTVGPTGRCLLCEETMTYPSVMGWLDAPGGKNVFVVCSDCTDELGTKTEDAICEKIGFHPIPSGSA